MPRIVCAFVLLAALGIGLAPGASAAAAAAAGPRLLGSLEWPAGPEDAIPQWQRVRAAIAAEAPAVSACAREPARCRDPGAAAWVALLARLAPATPDEQIREVNRFVNRWTYRTDLDVYGRSDFWATPLQFFARSGDCEDYAIAKYESLRRLGFPADRLRLVVLEDTRRGLAHAVLVVYAGADVLILDNLSGEPVPQARLPQYVPYYSLNELAGWRHAPPAAAAPALAATAAAPEPPAH